MTDLGVEEDIAFIRRTVEGGRAYARGRSADMLVWGLFVTAGFLNTYARLRHWPSLDIGWVWLVGVSLAWLYSLRHLIARLVLRRPAPQRSPMATALSMLWLGCGISMMTLAVAVNWIGDGGYHWYDAAVAGILAIAFFAGSFLCNLGWMRFVAAAWWASEIAFYVLHDNANVALLGAVMMFLFLAGPGLVLLVSGRTDA